MDGISPDRFGKGEGRFVRKLVLAAIAASANPDGTNAYPSMETIARRALLKDERHARKVVAWLREHNLITVKENAHETRLGSGKFTNEYRIIFDQQGAANEKPDAQMAGRASTVTVSGTESNQVSVAAGSAPQVPSDDPGTGVPGSQLGTPGRKEGRARDQNESYPGTKLERPRDGDTSNRPLNRPENRHATAQQQQTGAEAHVVAARAASTLLVSSSSKPILSREERDSLNALKRSIVSWWSHPRLVDCPMPCNTSRSQLAELQELIREEGTQDVFYAWIWWQVCMAETDWSELYLGESNERGEMWRNWPLREFLTVAAKYLRQVRRYSPCLRNPSAGFYPVALCFLLDVTQSRVPITAQQASRLKQLDRKYKLAQLRDAFWRSADGDELPDLGKFLDHSEELLESLVRREREETSVSGGEECTPGQLADAPDPPVKQELDTQATTSSNLQGAEGTSQHRGDVPNLDDDEPIEEERSHPELVHGGPRLNLDEPPEDVEMKIESKTSSADTEELKAAAIQMERFETVATAIRNEYQRAGKSCPWSEAVAYQLNRALDRLRSLCTADLVACVRNRFASEVNLAESPNEWLRWLEDYAKGPLDKEAEAQRSLARELKTRMYKRRASGAPFSFP